MKILNYATKANSKKKYQKSNFDHKVSFAEKSPNLPKSISFLFNSFIMSWINVLNSCSPQSIKFANDVQTRKDQSAKQP